MFATLQATMINVWTGERVSVDQIMGEVADVGEDPFAADEYDVSAELELAARMREEQEEREAEGWAEGLVPDEDAFGLVLAEFDVERALGGS